MKTMTKKFLFYALIILTGLSFPVPSEALWVWTPQTNKWENPKLAVKGTPAEQLAFSLELYRAKELEKAVTEFKKVIKYYPRAREAAEAQFYLGVIEEEEGNYSKAFKNYQTVVDQYPFSERFGEIIQRQYDLGMKLLEGKGRKRFFQGGGMGTEALVVEIFRTVIKNSPYGPYAAPSQYNIALYLQEEGLLPEARDEFEKTLNDYPESEWAKKARYQIALADARRSSAAPYEQKVTQVAIQELEEVLKETPDTAFSEEAQQQIKDLKNKEAQQNFLIAEFYEKRKEYRAAEIYYSKIVESYKDTPWASQALNKIRALNELGQP